MQRTRDAVFFAVLLLTLMPGCGRRRRLAREAASAREAAAAIALRTPRVDEDAPLCAPAAFRRGPLGCVSSEDALVAGSEGACRAMDPLDCARRCDAGGAPSCTNLGVIRTFGLDGVRDPVEARRLFERACTAGDLGGCNDLALALDGRAGEAARVEELLARACDGGTDAACANLARRLFDRAPERAAPLARRACDAGVAGACVALGRRGRDGARELFRKACTLRDAVGCDEAGGTYLGAGSDADAPYAAHLFGEACALGLAAGCNDLATLLVEGRGAPADERRARKLFARACDAGSGDACANLATRVRGDARAVERMAGRDAPEGAAALDAPALLERACTLGHARSCAPP